MGIVEPAANDTRVIELLDETRKVLSWDQIAELLKRLNENHYKLAKEFQLSIFKIHSLQHLCTETTVIVRQSVRLYVDSKQRLSRELAA